MSHASSSTSASEIQEVWTNSKKCNSIGQILTEIVKESSTFTRRERGNHLNKIELLEKQKKLSFTAKKPPAICIKDYVQRILRYTHIEEPTLIIALIYIDRICEFHDLILTELNIHRIVLTSIMTAIKYNEDDYYSNKYYAKVGGITLDEINRLEYEFIRLIRYSLFVENRVYDKYQTYLNHYKVKNVD